MAYLNNEQITVNAILTRKGRELLASEGGLTITHFALSDDELDYRLYQPEHPQGSEFYDLAVRNIPVMEPLADETQGLKYKLVTLSAGVTNIPIITINHSSLVLDKTYNQAIPIIPTTTPTYNATLGYTAILSNKAVGTITGQGLEASITESTIPVYLGDLSSTTGQTAVGKTFEFRVNNNITANTSARLTIVGNESGGSVTIPVSIYVEPLAESNV